MRNKLASLSSGLLLFACTGQKELMEGLAFDLGCPDNRLDLSPKEAEECTCASGQAELAFTDVTGEWGLAGIRTASTRDWSLFDMWEPGIAVADLSGDGAPDLYLPRYDSSDLQGRPDLYFQNSGNGSFVDQTAEAGFANESRQSTCAVPADVDLDGDLDLFVGTDGEGDWFWQNEGGVFVDVASVAGILDKTRRSYSAAFGDVDRDGDTDLYVAAWNGRSGHAPNVLYRNDGTGRFSKAASGSKCEGDSTLQAHFADLDNDGAVDLYVANDFFDDCLLANDGQGFFSDVTNMAGIGQGAAHAMGVAVGDYDRDGDLDIYVTDTKEPDAFAHNPFWHNEGGFVFTNVALDLGVEASFSWGAMFGDLDLDGDLDLHVGMHLNRQRVLYLGDGQGAFVDRASELGIDVNDDTRGSVLADLDGDGDLEIVLTNRGGIRVWRNDLSGPNHWLKVKAPIGSRVIVSENGQSQIAEVVAGTSYHSGTDPMVHFGLGGNSCAEITVRLPTGEMQKFGRVKANQLIEVP